MTAGVPTLTPDVTKGFWVATVLLPTYARQVAAQQADEVMTTLEDSLKTLAVIMAPMVLGLIALAEPIVSLLYERGAFTEDSVRWTARAIIAYAPGLLAFSAAKTVIPIFYAFKDLKTPVYVASWCILGNFLMNLASVLFLPEGWRHVGIATSTCINSLVNTLILLRILQARQLQLKWRGFTMVLLKSLVAATVMGAVVWGLNRVCEPLAPRWVVVPILILIGGVIYLPLIAWMAPATVKNILSDFITRRRRRKK